jgi:hypothetical protein
VRRLLAKKAHGDLRGSMADTAPRKPYQASGEQFRSVPPVRKTTKKNFAVAERHATKYAQGATT